MRNVKPTTIALLLVIVFPLLCSCLVIVATWYTAQRDAHLWREEFQRTLNTQCPTVQVDILGGDGNVYLNATTKSYRWIASDGILTCESDEEITNCSCRFDAENP